MDLNETKDRGVNGTQNYEGGEAYEPESAKLTLYKRTVNNLLSDTYYETDQEQLTNLVEAFDMAADEDPEFVLKLAAYSRQEMGLRDVSLVLLALAGQDDRFVTRPPEKGHQEDTMVRDYVPEVVRRMDEPAKVISIYLNSFENGNVPSPIKKGLSDAINVMADEYTLQKYRNPSREVNLYDVFNIVHPKPTDRVENIHGLTVEEREDLFTRFVRQDLDDYDVDELETPETWEVKISEKGNTKEAWEEVLPDLGIMARIRNVRNMLQVGLSGDDIFGEGEKEEVRNSKMFPFRFYQAYKAYRVTDVKDDDIEEFLSWAIDQTGTNLPDELQDTLVVADVSGSMTQPVSGRSDMTCMEIATFFAAVASNAGSDVGAFAEKFERVSFHRDTPSVERMRTLNDLEVGGATNGYLVFDELVGADKKFENIVFLTDLQMWNSRSGETSFRDSLNNYLDNVNEECNIFMVDLSSYGDLTVPESHENVYRVSGWNSKILDFIGYANRTNEIISEVEDFEI